MMWFYFSYTSFCLRDGKEMVFPSIDLLSLVYRSHFTLKICSIMHKGDLTRVALDFK